MGRTKAQHPRRTRPAPASAPAADARAAAGSPVVIDGFHRFHPEARGWNMERWLLPSGDGDPDLGQHAATELQEHLDSSSQVTLSQAGALRDSTVTMHYYLDAGYDDDPSYFQGVLYSPAAGWFAVERLWSEDEDEGEFPDDPRVWIAPTMEELIPQLQGGLPDLRAGLNVEDWECGFVSHHLRDALAAVPDRA
ncbi:hypothetical protein [Kitasatospora sp. GP82]|uniref:hypothetical protein n=1 Tax=Kitasatospora sp. GP82 TaxID=3035089 RepID=UPI0024759979|nr:hypothetical protein [Kitasatospora sp. GP82]MDH6130063.1 hypothetical protein [Kitasatospora sp. GP82]